MEQKNEKRSIDNVIIHPEIQPGVIDNAMLIRCILENGPKDEAGRLFAEEGVHLEETLILRLEFQKILRIDHLWMLTSLTKLTLAHNLIEKIENLEQLTSLNELDLSFNKIEKIENLDTLVNLEVLTLFHNRIRKLENMDTLENLLVFSIGDNLIEDFKEVIYLRRFRKLRSVSCKGNPCNDDPSVYEFYKSALPRVTYLDYKVVAEEERESGRNFFRSLLRQLDEADEISEKQRLAKEEYEKQFTFHQLSFVEYLSGTELLYTMFEKDPDGTLLLTFGGELVTFFEQYKEQYVETMTGLVEWALWAYDDRKQEIELFNALIENALAENVEKSKAVVQEYELTKKPLVHQLKDLITKFISKTTTAEETELAIMDVSDVFNDTLYDTWKKLITLEIQLFEQCEESHTIFKVNITEKITKLLEVARTAFGAWREHDAIWTMRQSETLSKYIRNRLLLSDMPQELIEVMMDRDKMMNAVAQSSDNHMRFIDAREDLLASRSKGWCDDLVKHNTDHETKRNRDRILEINYFIDNQRIDWLDMQEVLNEPDVETAALLGDEI